MKSSSIKIYPDEPVHAGDGIVGVRIDGDADNGDGFDGGVDDCDDDDDG